MRMPGVDLNVSSHFSYLDSELADDCYIDEEVNRSLGKASISFGRICKRVIQTILRVRDMLDTERF